MSLRLSVVTLFTLVLLALGDDKTTDPPPSARVYKSPESVHAASVAASEKGDVETAIHCVAPSAHADMAAFFAFNGLIARTVSDKQPKLFAGVLAVLDKHGLTKEATKDVSTSDQKAALKALAPLIKKPTEFAIEMSKAQHEFAAKMGGGKKPKVTHKLTNLKIEGTKATATVVMTLGEQTFEHPMAFVKVGDGWKMVPDFTLSMNLRPKK